MSSPAPAESRDPERTPAGSGPEISVVIASQGAPSALEACLHAIEAQAGGHRLEVMVVDNARDGDAERIVRRFPGVALTPGPPGAAVPELWAIGVGRSRGRVVALTNAQCVPDPHWLAAIRRAHGEPAAIGGAIEPDPTGDLRTWALYFCRYSRYMRSRPEGPAGDLAADNASYGRAELWSCRETWQRGFWEPAVHAALGRGGVPLRFVPSVVVQLRGPTDVWQFARQRLRHGRAFGAWRASTVSGPRQVLYAVSAPVLPVLLLARVARRVWAARRYRARFLCTLPLLALFLGAWSLGELLGTVHRSADAG